MSVMGSYHKLISYTLSITALLLITGCIPVYSFVIGESDSLLEQIDKDDSLIVSGTTNRTGVQSRLGKPLFSDQKVKMEVYQIRADELEVTNVLVMPIYAAKTDLNAFFLIRYDDDWIVSESDHFMIVESSGVWRNLDKIGFATVDGAIFWALWRTEEIDWWRNESRKRTYLLVDFDHLALLHQENKDNCTAHLSITGETIDELFINSTRINQSLLLGLQIKEYSKELQKKLPASHKSNSINYHAILQLPTGEQSIHSKWLLDDAESSVNYYCKSGEDIYIQIYSSSSNKKALLFGSYLGMDAYGISINKEPPETLKHDFFLIDVDAQKVNMLLIE